MRLSLRNLLGYGVVLVSSGVVVLAQDGQPSYDELLRTVDELRHGMRQTEEFNQKANARIGELERDVEWFRNERIPTLERDWDGQLQQKQGLVDNCHNEKDNLSTNMDACLVQKNSLSHALGEKENTIRDIQDAANSCANEKGSLAQVLSAKEEELNQHVHSCNNDKTVIKQDSQRDLGLCETQKLSCHDQVQTMEQTSHSLQGQKEQLEHSLRQLNEEQIPALKADYEEKGAQCRQEAASAQEESQKQHADLEKQMKKQVNSLEDKLSGLQSKSDKQKTEIKKAKKELKESNDKYYDTRQDLHSERESVRKLQDEKDTTMIFVNFPLIQTKIITFYDDYLKSFCDPIIKHVEVFYKKTFSPWYTKTAVPAVKNFYYDTALPALDNVQPIMQTIYKDAIVPVVDVLEEKEILPTIRQVWNKYVFKIVLKPFHREFTRLIREASKMGKSYMQLNNFSPTFINTAEYIRKHPNETAILYYKIFSLWFGIILLKLIFFSGGSHHPEPEDHPQSNGTSSNKRKKKNKNKNPQSPAQQLYEMESKKSK